ncbi:hypothetical protein BDN72DRAFT_848929 [Pluteus cervinus]|uniref:Uncharacterized protein n=1 Tax=Pluteus cervinus TaxID=181527 RepID=A0ACD3A8X7_9AGAR|nr:hypothetical protein BDN72DRAFT_848929 [Pluteus cervinus]
MFFCIPVFFGCQTQIKPQGGQPSRVCPRCHNASVFVAKSTTWFELFWIPLIPFSSKHIWLCGICRWKAPCVEGQFEPAIAHMPPPAGYPPNQGWQQPNVPGYQPVYIQPLK